MNYEDLRPVVNELYGYFNRKAPNEKQVELWAKELDYIPSETRRYLYNELIKQDNIPSNIPKVIKGIYHQWRKEHPEKVAFQREDCEYCKGLGGLTFQIKGYDFMCRCGHCTNWRGSFGEESCAIYTIYKIQEMGGTVQD